MRSATLTASREIATEGGWANNKGEALLTYIKGQNRANLTIRGSQSSNLFESERAFVPRLEAIPYSAFGNVTPVIGSEIDPGLSALVGQQVGVLALPQGLATPSLTDLLGGANKLGRASEPP